MSSDLQKQDVKDEISSSPNFQLHENESEKIDSVHSLKYEELRNQEFQNKQQKYREESLNKHEEEKSDSEPGIPNLGIQEQQYNSIVLQSQNNSHLKAKNLLPLNHRQLNLQSDDKISKRKKSVQFLQEPPLRNSGAELELVPIRNKEPIEQPEIPSTFKVRRSSAIDRDIEERIQIKKQKNNYEMLHKVIDPFWSQSMTQILNFREGKNNSSFAQLWSFLFFMIQTYNFFTAFFFLGIRGQPTGTWYLLEVICEILMIFDFVARWVIRVHFSSAWQQMYLLHDRGGVTKFHFYIRLIASVPYQIIISIAVQKHPEVRENIFIASLRLLKLLKFAQVIEYFNALEFQKRQQKNFSLLQTLFVAYYLSCYIHVGNCLICLVGRIDPEANDENNLGWIRQLNLNKFGATIYDIYREAFVNNLTTSLGLSFGQLIATTNFEYFAWTIWFLSGASIVVGYYSWMVAEWSLRNIKMYENSFRYEQAKQFCDIRNLPQDIRLRIRYYYQNLRIDFEEYNEKTKILEQLPDKMKTQIAPLFNSQVLKNIKFLQMAKPDFVSKVACRMQPEVCLADDLIVKYNEIADKMYFVQEGNLEVLSTDHFTSIAFLGAGTYFGEIGVLITGKRSLSIKALTNCICYSIKTDDFLAILEEFPEQTQFLRAVGYQRLQTTHPEEIMTQRTSGKDSVARTNSNINNGAFNSARSKYDKDISFLRSQSMPDSKKYQNDKIKTKLWLTKQFSDIDFFIIMPFSQAFYIWNTVMFLAFNYVLFIVPYGIGFKEDLGFDPALIVCQLVFAIDIPVRMRTGITEPKHITTNLEQIFTYYINNWLFYDMLASIPIEYVLQIYYPEISRWIMLLKFFKIGRLYETLQIYLQNTNVGHFHCMFAVYCYIMYAFIHVGACMYCYFCEMYPDGSYRYDGRSLISYYKSLPFSDGDPMTWSNQKKYGFYWYISSKTVGNQGYGDTSAMTEQEQYLSLIQVYFGRVIMAFACSDTANYLGEIYKSQQRKLMSTSYLNQWMKKIKLPQELIQRVGVFNQMHFRFQHQIDENQIMEGLPPTLIKSIKNYLFAPLIRTWEAISKENIGEVMSIIEQLELVTFPENEYIVKIGEVADEMYFIVDGLCQVLAADGSQLAVLKQGQNFGEMALLDQNLPMRLASVRTLTTVKLAKLDRQNFSLVSELYPQFKENIVKMVQARLKELINSKHSQQGNLREQILLKLQASESLSYQSSDLSESLTDSDFEEELAKLGHTDDESIYIHDENDQDHLGGELRQKTNDENPVSPQAQKRKQWLKQAQLHEQNKQADTDMGDVITTERKLISSKEPIGRNQNMRMNLKKSSNKVAHLDDRSSVNTRRQLSSHTSNTSKKSTRTDNQGSKKKGLVRSTTERLAANLAEMSQQQEKFELTSRSFFYGLNWKTFYKFILQLVVHYNVWFIPIHTAYKFPFDGIYLAFEAITIIVYGFELFYRFFKYWHLTNILVREESSLSIKDRKLRQDYDKLKSKIQIQKLEFALTVIAIVPLNLIFQKIGWYEFNIWLDILVMTLRIVKYRQISKIFEKLVPINLPLIRVLETIYYNYVFSNYSSVIFVDLCIWTADARTTWLRRLPVIPSMVPGKVRLDPNYRSDLSNWQVYLYSQYYIQNTLSHVAIGDITVTNEAEFYFNSIFMIVSTFVYIYLFANIASIVSNLSSEIHVEFLKKRNTVLQKITNNHMPKSLIQEINLYFDYQFFKYNGLTEQEMTEKLPDRIKLDIQLSQYQSVINSCLLFRKLTGEFDITLANSVLRTLKTHIYLSENYITKVGQTFYDSFIVLEGSVSVCGYYNNENLGQLGPGDFFGTDLDDKINLEIDKNYFQYTQGEPMPKLKLNAKDNFENRSLLHLVSKTFVVVGILSKSDKRVLYKAFPELQQVFRRCNRYLFDLGRKQIEKSIWDQDHEQPTRQACLQKVKDQISSASFDFYEDILRKQRQSNVKETKNLSYIIKNYFIMHQNQQNQKPLYRAIYGKEKQSYTVEAEKQGASWCCEDAYIEEHSRLKRAIRYIHFFNLVYTSFALPFYIGYNIRIRGVVLFVEILSSAISFLVFFLNFRTPYIENGQRSTAFLKIARQYLKNGMIVDFFGMLPLNITLDFQFDLVAKDRMIVTCFLIGFARLTRLFSVVQIVNIFELIKLETKKNRATLQGLGNIMFCVVVGHWIVCMWTFLILVIEQHDKDSWWYFQKMDKTPYWSCYIHNWYAVINITTGAGSGDIYAVTDIERAFFCFMMNCGDVIFALAFGLINQIALNTRLDDETGNFINTMVKIERSLAKFEISGTLKDQIEQFYTFKQKIQISPSDLSSTELESYMPRSLVRKVLYYQFGDLVRPFCEDFDSENLVADICFYLKSRVCMPDDFIMSRGELGSHIYFFEEGEALMLGVDGKKVIKTLQKGSYVGDLATLIGAKRNVSVRAKTFVLIKEISKQDLETILVTYPEIHQQFIQRALNAFRQQESELKSHELLVQEFSQDVLRINDLRQFDSENDYSSENSDSSEESMLREEEVKRESNTSFKTQSAMNQIKSEIEKFQSEQKSFRLKGHAPSLKSKINQKRRQTVVDNTSSHLRRKLSIQVDNNQDQVQIMTQRLASAAIQPQNETQRNQHQDNASAVQTQKSQSVAQRRLSDFSIEQSLVIRQNGNQVLIGSQPLN